MLKSLFTLYLSSLILIVIALAQFFNSRVNFISPWKGGGFGVFSTVDQPHLRFIRAYIELGDQSKIFLKIPPADKELVDKELILKAVSIPTNKMLLQVGQSLLLANNSRTINELTSINGKDTKSSNNHSSNNQTQLRIEVWKTSFNVNASRLEPLLLKEEVFPIDLIYPEIETNR